MDFTLKQAVEADIEFLLELRDITMRKHLEELGLPTTREVYMERIRHHFECAQIIYVADAKAGLFKSKFDEDANEWHLLQIQIHPKFQNRKIGRNVISNLINQANTKGSSIKLSVVKTNPAHHLYSKLGFSVVDENESQYLMKYGL